MLFQICQLCRNVLKAADELKTHNRITFSTSCGDLDVGMTAYVSLSFLICHLFYSRLAQVRFGWMAYCVILSITCIDNFNIRNIRRCNLHRKKCYVYWSNMNVYRFSHLFYIYCFESVVWWCVQFNGDWDIWLQSYINIFEHFARFDIVPREISLRWMSEDLVHEKSTYGSGDVSVPLGKNPSLEPILTISMRFLGTNFTQYG